MEILPDELLQRLDALATVTGSSLEILWAALVKGGFGLGVVSAIGVVFALAGVYTSFLLGRASFRHKSKDYNDDTKIFLGFSCAALSLASVIALVECLLTVVYLFAPELYAAKRFLDLLR